MDTPQPNAPNHDDTPPTEWTWPIVGSVIAFLVFISWTGKGVGYLYPWTGKGVGYLYP